MQQKTKGIVLDNRPYNDKYSIVHVFTESFGRIAYMLPRRASKKQSLAKALFMPMSLIEVEANCSEKREIYPLKEARSLCPLHHIYTSPVKSSLLFFLAETLSKALREAPTDRTLFRYIEESVVFLENTEQSAANFHLVFLFHLTRYLGFPPNLKDYTETAYFDLADGCFTPLPPAHRHYLSPNEAKTLITINRMDFTNLALFSFSNEERRRILDYFIEYLRLHIPNFGNLKSYEVLKEVFL